MTCRPLPCLRILLLPLLVLAAAPAGAAELATNRLFLSFAEDAALANRQWWEGQLDFSKDAAGGAADLLLVRAIAAFQPMDHLEVGGRVGFGDSDTSGGLEDGTGATDLDLWGKYQFGDTAAATVFAAGATVIVPTGDDSVGLGTDAFSIGAFGTARHALSRAILSGHLGLRLNGDGRIFGIDLEGETSAQLGFAYIAPLSDEITFIGEARYESERFDGGDADTRLLGGVNWRVFNTGIVRAAVAFGLSDGAPDAQALLGYAAQF